MLKRTERTNTNNDTSTMGFRSVLTSLPVTQITNPHKYLEASNKDGIMQLLAEKYTEKTGITITKDYTLHVFHINEILKWEETKEAIGPFFTSVISQGKGDPLSYIATLLVTARVSKNIVVIEVDNKHKLNLIKDDSLKFALNSETILIDN